MQIHQDNPVTMSSNDTDSTFVYTDEMRADDEAAQKRANESANDPNSFENRFPEMIVTWAHTASIMAKGDDSGFDWDQWKDDMKDADMAREFGGDSNF